MSMKEAISGDLLDLCRSGNVYHAASYFSVAQSATTYFQMKTGASSALVVKYSLVAATQSCRFKALEAPTVTDGTTPVSALNVNRTSAATATMTLFSDPTSISSGTALIDSIIASGGNKTGGGVGESVFWTMKPDTSYVVSVENLGNSTTACTFELAWLEIKP